MAYFEFCMDYDHEVSGMNSKKEYACVYYCNVFSQEAYFINTTWLNILIIRMVIKIHAFCQ